MRLSFLFVLFRIFREKINNDLPRLRICFRLLRLFLLEYFLAQLFNMPTMNQNNYQAAFGDSSGVRESNF
jgi:hypothetical protein